MMTIDDERKVDETLSLTSNIKRIAAWEQRRRKCQEEGRIEFKFKLIIILHYLFLLNFLNFLIIITVDYEK